MNAPDALADGGTATETYEGSLDEAVDVTTTVELVGGALSQGDINDVTLTTGTGSVTASQLLDGHEVDTADGDVALEIEFASGVDESDEFEVSIDDGDDGVATTDDASDTFDVDTTAD